MKFNVYLDDLRQEPEGFVRVHTAQECIDFLKDHNGEIGILSLDHDLGICPECLGSKSTEDWLIRSGFTSLPNCEHVGTGYTVCLWLEEQVHTDPAFVLPQEIKVHSANPVGRERMLKAIQAITSISR